MSPAGGCDPEVCHQPGHKVITEICEFLSFRLRVSVPSYQFRRSRVEDKFTEGYRASPQNLGTKQTNPSVYKWNICFIA